MSAKKIKVRVCHSFKDLDLLSIKVKGTDDVMTETNSKNETSTGDLANATYIAEFFNFIGLCIGSVEIKDTTTFVRFPVGNRFRYFEMQKKADPTRYGGFSYNFYECQEPKPTNFIGAISDADDAASDDTEADTQRLGWKLWLDDDLDSHLFPTRRTPDGFIGAKSSIEAIELIKQYGLPTVMDIDYQLGQDDTAKKFLFELVHILDIPLPPPPMVNVHSASPAHRKWVTDFIETWRKASETEGIENEKN